MSAVSIVSLLASMNSRRRHDLFAQSPPQVARWVYMLAAEGLPQAEVCYGRLLLEGTGVQKDAAAALIWFRRAAARGDIEALNMVGRCFDNGWGTLENPAAAAVFYSRAAYAGDIWAQYNLGHLYLDGRGVERDLAKAYALYRLAADRGHERAMNLVGRCAEEGWGTSQDLDAAADWYRRSAEAGYFRGQYNWASILLKSGHIDEAVLWFEKAAIAGTPGVQRAVTALINESLRRGGEINAFERLATRLNAASST